MSRRPKIFFAIPCGEYYSVQASIIHQVCIHLDIDIDIIEDDPTTKGLWKKITERIDNADYFIADITSRSPNIIVELGFAVARKPIKNIGVFLANYVSIPSDLGGYIIQKYSSYSTFMTKLTTWIEATVPSVDPKKVKELSRKNASFEEDFLDKDILLQRWSFRPESSYLLTDEGLKFSWSHFPIITRNLSILRDCEFEFTGKILSSTIGWVIKGTTPLDLPIPSFCIMFNLNKDLFLTPHIWTITSPHPETQYHAFNSERCKIDLTISKEGWFTLLTRVTGDVVQIIQNETVLFNADFSKPPYANLYSTVPHKMGQIGFRCHPGEIGLVRNVIVKEL